MPGGRITIFQMFAQTRRQREVLDFIVRYIDSHGYRPSYQVIARHLGLASRAGIGRIVSDLEGQGFLERQRVGGHFAINLKRADHAEPGGPLIKWIDLSSDAKTNGELSPFCLPAFMLGGHQADDLGAFSVPDDGMSENAICRGDIAIIELRPFARDGDLVAALVDKREAVLRKYYRAGTEIELCTNTQGGEEKLRLAADKVEILGVFRGLIRPIC